MSPSIFHPQETQAFHAILAVDDDTQILSFLKTFLTQKGYSLYTAKTFKTAEKILSQEPIDLILTDLVLPQGSGFEFIKKVRKKQKNTLLPILVLTYKQNREDLKQAVSVGATDYLLKPIDEHLLLEKLSQLLEHTNSLKGKSILLKEKAFLRFSVTLVELGETFLILESPFPVEKAQAFELEASLFQNTNISIPKLHLIICQKIQEDPLLYQLKFKFSHLSHKESSQLKKWVHQKAL